MFTKILIANRGEIACRIHRTAQRLGINTVAIYSEADRYALHVSVCDEAYCVGPAASRDSYLAQEKIIDVALKSGAEAIHPGYGFLSENASFAQKVIEAGLIFIGPKPETIHTMGDKLEAKALAAKAGVNLVPGSIHPLTTPEEVWEFGEKFGYPLLLKAAAGGGGKGMRVIRSKDEVPESFAQASSEALKSFSDGRVFIERYIDNPRHIEVQILGDKQGNIVHLGERDCSLQRRHQKIIEEAPSPFVTPELRKQLTSQALALAKAVNYDSAGTVEFIVSSERECFFLEMNTRLQVEHPVTEMVYHVDLVEHMIRIASGEKLTLNQEDLTPKGWAVEARLYSEDPYQDFMPSAGRITTFRTPDLSHFRSDVGVREGDMVSMFYDPMIGKIIAHGKDRHAAIAKLAQGLQQIQLEGPLNNRTFLIELLHNADFQQGNHHTHLIEKEELTTPNSLASFRQLKREDQEHFLKVAASVHHHCINAYEQGELIVTVDGTPFPLSNPGPISLTWTVAHKRFSCHWQDQVIHGEVHLKNSGFSLGFMGIFVDVLVVRQSIWRTLQDLPAKKEKHEFKMIKSPMPGVLVSLPIAVGDQVRKGQTMAVIEAMKMENAIKAPMSGVVSEVLVTTGDSLSRDQIIAKFGT